MFYFVYNRHFCFIASWCKRKVERKKNDTDTTELNIVRQLFLFLLFSGTPHVLCLNSPDARPGVHYTQCLLWRKFFGLRLLPFISNSSVNSLKFLIYWRSFPHSPSYYIFFSSLLHHFISSLGKRKQQLMCIHTHKHTHKFKKLPCSGNLIVLYE